MEDPLNEILRCLDRTSGPLCASQLAQAVNAPTDVVEGMLRTLVSMGRVCCLSEDQACGWCPLRAACDGLPAEERLYYHSPNRTGT
ncbi:MAG: FeoC-like transcriptional regulator [Anaerolineales bacterium]|jgi:endonuclease III